MYQPTAWAAPPKSPIAPYSALDELAEYSRQEVSGIERVRG
jgi:hypothetical protein